MMMRFASSEVGAPYREWGWQRKEEQESSRKSAGFTLIELLAVIAVIAILAALLLPTLNRAKEQAYTTACRSNLHQLGLAFQSYLGDFQAYPPDDAEALVPYVGEKYLYIAPPGVAPSGLTLEAPQAPRNSVYDCPAYDRLPAYQSAPFDYNSYGYNHNGVASLQNTNLTYSGLGLGGKGVTYSLAPNAVWPSSPPIREAEVLRPADMFAMGDSPLRYNYIAATQYKPVIWGDALILMPIPKGPYSGGYSGPVCLGDGVYQRRHNMRFNVLLCDGHVETLRIDDIFSIRPAVLARWNNDNQPHSELVMDFQSR
jgi:prepilin-type N-terminal cleavage/methylation domain-containing protein/prepilin-type processing-associated H-X9-DG protein